MTELSRPINETLIQNLSERSEFYREKSLSESTKISYSYDWSAFTDWCFNFHFCPLPADPKTVELYITHLSDLGRAVSTISRSITSIRQAHILLSYESPTDNPMVRKTWEGIRKTIGTAKKQAKPLAIEDLKKIVDTTMPTFLGRRDAAILLLGWVGALRRSEIVNINVEDIQFVDEGMILTILRSKTDQEGRGYKIGIPHASEERYSAPLRLRNWIELSRIETGPLFFSIGMRGKGKFTSEIPDSKKLSANMINVILEKRLRQAGIDPTGYSGHSLRSGFITHAAKLKIPENLIQRHTRHASIPILRQYIRLGNIFEENPTKIML